MEEKNVKRKEWVKTAAIIFLSIMLVLTVFSGTIMNYSLPEIATEYVMPESITSQVRGTGTVEAGDPYNVIIEENRVIKSVAVTNGDVVEKGQTLFYLEDSMSPEMEKLIADIEAAELQFKQALLAENVSNEVYNNVQNGVVTDTATYQANIQAQKQAVADIEKTLTDLKNWKTYLESKLYEMGASDMDINTANANADDAKTAQATAQAEVNNYTAQLDKYDADLAAGTIVEDAALRESLVNSLNTAQATLDAKNNEVHIADSIVSVLQQLNTTNANITTATNNLGVAQDSLAQMQTNVQTEIALSAQKQSIADMKAQLAELEAKSVGGVIVAPISGTVSGISHVAGESFTAGETVAVMQAEGKGHTLSFSVTNKQAATLSVGVKGEVSNSWYYSDVVATLISIKPDTADPTGSKKLTFNLEGDVTAGQSLTLSVGDKSSNYDYTVPNNAVREDKDGKFILVLEQKSSPLGNRYFAVRKDVEVLASDDRRTAIQGDDVYAYEYVVTTSTQPIEEGQQVRLKED